MRLALAAALASAALVTPAHAAAEPVQGGCTYVRGVTGVAGSGIQYTLVGYAVSSTPAYATGVSCWFNGYGPGLDTGVPGMVAVGEWSQSLPTFVVTLCEQHWALLVGGGSYTSPVHCG
ncbi:MAG TPA: hypothetical protein VGX28_01865 [Frankiaceae bacterium]|jgi:hypothetical protein|nr:hypothetical protein [Frankiaceae bacterium]